MYQSDTEMLFPPRVIPSLRDLRGKVWHDLVERVVEEEEGSAENLAFCLLMIRLDGCLTCHADSYRAMRGCTSCAQLAIMRYKGNDSDLLHQFKQAKVDVERYQRCGIVDE
ncbi:MAG: hypothetical protein HY260_03935 [Chloroflexi bacterium]|nr:hypothetical protein [Chloroflexota bacterium]